MSYGGCQTLSHASLGFPFHFLQQTQTGPWVWWDSRNKIRLLYRLVTDHIHQATGIAETKLHCCTGLSQTTFTRPLHCASRTKIRLLYRLVTDHIHHDQWVSRNKIRLMYRLVLAFRCCAYLPHTVQMSTWHRHCSDQHCDTAQQKYCPQQWKHPSHQNEPATDVTKIKNKHKNTSQIITCIAKGLLIKHLSIWKIIYSYTCCTCVVERFLLLLLGFLTEP